MTAAFDATRGTDQRFTDALSGSDGTADPSILMPVLDVYPDALSAPMPVDLVPVVLPQVLLGGQPSGGRADQLPSPARASGRQPDRRQPAAQRGSARQGAPIPPTNPYQATQYSATSRQSAPPQPGQRTTAYGQPAAIRPAAGQPARSRQPTPAQPTPGRSATGYSPTPPVSPRAANQGSFQGRTVTAADVAAMFRNLTSGQSERIDQQSFQATHPQSMGSVSPSAVAPAAPMASQYTQRGQARNTARDQAQQRRRSSSTPKKRSSSIWAVVVFLVVIGFASGAVQKIIDLITELLNR